MKNRLGLGIIGTGGRGRGLAQTAHDPRQGIFVMGGADIDHSALKAFRDDFDHELFVTTNYQELLRRGDIDAVIISSRDYLHAKHDMESLKHGKAVYLEKPMSISIENCDEILSVAKQLKGKLYLGHNMRHSPVVLKMKELIAEGAIGEVRAGWCRHFISYGGDAFFKDYHAEANKATRPLLSKASHDIDVLHWLCGSYSKRVCGFGNLSVYSRVKDRHAPSVNGDATWYEEHWPPLSQIGLNPVIDVEDLSMVLMELNNGAMCSYHQCHYTPDAWRNYTIIGTEGRLENFGDNSGECVVRLYNRRTSYHPYGDQQYFIPPKRGGHGGADVSIMQEFIDFACDGDGISITPVDARHSVAVGCSATESIRAGGMPVKVPDLSQDVYDFFNQFKK